jgi:tetratricopeptide (TPR) repeat protein
LYERIRMNFLRRDFIVREPLLVGVLVLITIVFSTLTHSYTAAYDRRRGELGKEWFERGNRELKNNQSAAAIEDFRTALLYAPENWDYRLHLAEALTLANRTNQAFDYYLSLWQSNPRNGPVNLQLARLTARAGQKSEAERYFNGAIFGDWSDHAAEHRRDALFELVNFYLENGDTGQAESQLLILSTILPEDAISHTRVADLYYRVGDDQRALSQYRQAMQINPRYLPAVRGAGEAAFLVGDYHAAQNYLGRVLREDDANAEARKLLGVAQTVLSLNPFEHGIPESEKVRRSLRVFEIAGKRLQSCNVARGTTEFSFHASLLEAWKKWRPNANYSYLTRHADGIDTLFDFSATIEKQTQSLCGEATSQDTALLAIARLHEKEEK